jgi:uncharacterized damage-inducible protein DinB
MIKQYLTDTFHFNDGANREMMKKLTSLPDKTMVLKHLSHLINSQNKWMERIIQNPEANTLSWWDPVYAEEELLLKWETSVQRWLDFIASKSEEELNTEVIFTGFDGAQWAATPADIALQLNYHSIHHRAQIQLFIREQGVEPDFIDYIGTKYRRIG